MRRLVLGVLMLFGAGCSATIKHIGDHQVRLSLAAVRLHGHALPLHLSTGFGASAPLLMYATGDGGWIGQDVELFDKLVAAGYPVVGFSARFYVSHLRDGNSQESSEDLAADYATIADTALIALHLPPGTPLVLVGESRGAGLAVAAASIKSLQPRIAGILAVALTAEEEYVTPLGNQPVPHPFQVKPYSELPRLAMPIAVIQSTVDEYLPADEARVMFGPDTPARRFRAIDASNHSFDGAVDKLYEEVAQSLRWVLNNLSGRSAG